MSDGGVVIDARARFAARRAQAAAPAAGAPLPTSSTAVAEAFERVVAETLAAADITSLRRALLGPGFLRFTIGPGERSGA